MILLRTRGFAACRKSYCPQARYLISSIVKTAVPNGCRSPLDPPTQPAGRGGEPVRCFLCIKRPHPCKGQLLRSYEHEWADKADGAVIGDNGQRPCGGVGDSASLVCARPQGQGVRPNRNASSISPSFFPKSWLPGPYSAVNTAAHKSFLVSRPRAKHPDG